MGVLAEKLGKKASEKVTQLYNAGIRKRNEIMAERKERKREDKEFKRQLKRKENIAYKQEAVRQAKLKGKRRAKQGSGVKHVLTGLGNTAELMFPEFTGKQQSTRKKKKSKPRSTRDEIDDYLGF